MNCRCSEPWVTVEKPTPCKVCGGAVPVDTAPCCDECLAHDYALCGNPACACHAPIDTDVEWADCAFAFNALMPRGKYNRAV